jgi:hypothetical protein
MNLSFHADRHAACEFIDVTPLRIVTLGRMRGRS